MLSIEMLYVLGLLLVGVAIAFGIRRSSTRNKANDAVSEAATRELYKDPDRYEAVTQDKLNDQIKPS